MRLPFLIACAAAFALAPAGAQIIERLSVTSSGIQADGATVEVAISDDGAWIALASAAPILGLPPPTLGMTQVYLRNRATGVVIPVSVDAAGIPGDDDSRFVRISGDGRYVLFESKATNLGLPNPVHLSRTLRFDRLTGVLENVAPGTGSFWSAGGGDLSADGRYVAYRGAGASLDVRRYDFVTGQDELVSVAPGGGPSAATSLGWPAISADGSHVAWTSDAADLVPGDANGLSDLFVRDMAAGLTVRASVSSTGVEGDANVSLAPPGISADGRVVSFVAEATTLAPGIAGFANRAFVHELDTGSTTLASVPGGVVLQRCHLSDDGLRVVYGTFAPVVPEDGNGLVDVAAFDRLAGTTILVSRGLDGLAGDGHSPPPSSGTFAARSKLSLSSNGGLVAFVSDATSMVPLDTNLATDAFLAALDCAVTFQTIGQGTPGAGGFTPYLVGIEGSCLPGTPSSWAIAIVAGLGGDPGLLVIAPEPAVEPILFAGGVFHLELTLSGIFPIALYGPAGVPGAGSWLFSGVDLSPLRGLDVYLQAILQGGAPGSPALTNALRLRVL